MIGRLDNSAISKTAATMALPDSHKVITTTVRSTTLDSLVPPYEHVILLKVDVQGHELQVLKGAANILARPGLEAPFLVYEEDERLLQAGNSSSREILHFLEGLGYKYCRKEGTDRHCWKVNPRAEPHNTATAATKRMP